MRFLFVFIVVFGWYFYFAVESGGLFILFVLAIATLICVSMLRRYHLSTQSAHNVVAAAATYKSLSPDDQRRVHEHAIKIILKCGWGGVRPPVLEDDVQRYGWYALSMSELDIKPVCLINRWNLVRNPYREALNRSHYLHTSMQLAARKGYSISLNIPTHIR